VNPILAGLALVVVAGTVVAVSVRDGRSAVLGLSIVLLLSPLLADPMADPAALAARSIGTILATYLLWIAVRDRADQGLLIAPTEGTRIGWPAEVLLAASAVVVGAAAHGLGAPAAGPELASAAGLLAAGMTVVVAGTVAALGRAARADGTGGFGFGGDAPVRVRHEPDAHPLGDPPHRAA
jgi:hypothetical protein